MSSMKLLVVCVLVACLTVEAMHRPHLAGKPSKYHWTRQQELMLELEARGVPIEEPELESAGGYYSAHSSAAGGSSFFPHPQSCAVANCATCASNSAVTCAQCYTGYALSGGQCVAAPPACTVTNCQTCYSGYSQYCQVCNNGYSLTSSYQCQASSGSSCTVAHCTTCYSGYTTACQTCNSGYTVTSNYQCSQTITCNAAHCQTCVSGSGSQCAVCMSGYTLSNGQCTITPVTCTVANCQTCVAGSGTQCQTCNSGYVVQSGSCVAASTCNVNNCQTCASGNANSCQTCASGYTRTSAGQCQVSGGGSGNNCGSNPAPSSTFTMTTDLSAGGCLRPVENQGQCGCCATFSSTHTVNDNIALLNSGTQCGSAQNPPLSEQYVVDCVAISNYCGTGASMQQIWQYWAQHGSVANNCVPYSTQTSQNGASGSCPALCSNSAAFPFSPFTIQSTYVSSLAAMKAALDAGHTISFGIALQQQFQTDFASASYACSTLYPTSTGSSTIIGGHAMEIVGYGTYNGQGFWKVKNSWDTNWGCHGYVFIKQGQPAYQGGPALETLAQNNYYPTGTSCIQASPFELAAAEYQNGQQMAAQAKLEEELAKMEQQGVAQSAAGVTVGGASPAPADHPLVAECATFAAEALLALPPTKYGFGCLGPNINNTWVPTGTDAVAQSITVNVYSSTTQVTSGQMISVLFSFTTTDDRCLNAKGTFSATVHATADGMLYLLDVHPATPVSPSSSGLSATTIIAIVVPLGVVFLAIVVYLVWRWNSTRVRFQKLHEAHTSYVRRATAVAQDSTFDATARAHLAQVLTPTQQEDDWDTYRQAPSRPPPSGLPSNLKQQPSRTPPSTLPPSQPPTGVEMHSMA